MRRTHRKRAVHHRRRVHRHRRLTVSRRKRHWISRKIKFLIDREGKSPKQAAAIAYSMAGVARRKRRRA